MNDHWSSFKKKEKKERGKNGQKSATSFFENEQRKKRERKFQLFFEKMRRKKRGRRTHRRSSTTCQPTSPAPNTRAGTEKDLAVERKKFNFQGVLFLCSSSVTLFKFAPLCCLFARNSVSIVQIYFALAFEGKRVLNGLVCKHRNTCSNAKICVFCCSSVKIRVFCRCQKCKSIL